MDERYVVLGLARSRTRWFGELGRWATAAVAPIDFVKCLSTEEARAVLGAGRPASVLLVDADLPRLDRDVIAAADRAGVPTILVGRPGTRDWENLGCAARLGPDFDRDQLVELLDRVARRIDPDDVRDHGRIDLAGGPTPGRLVGVLGSGGVGTSTVAMALAQAWADDGSDVVLVDGCRRSDLAMYHDVGDVLPGMAELVDLHRGDDADPAEIRATEFPTRRGYRVLLGLRRPRDWAGLRARTVEAAVDGLRRTHDAVVVDLEADLESEADTGSADVEDRHAAALAVARGADAIVVVGRTDLKGLHDVARTVHDVMRTGVSPGRMVVVANRAPRSPVARAQAARAIRSLVEQDEPVAVTFVRDQRGTEVAHRTAERLPGNGGRAVLAAVRGALALEAQSAPLQPVRVRVGELGATPELRR